MELWSICHWPDYLRVFYVHFPFCSIFLLISFQLTRDCHILISVTLPLAFFSVTFSLLFCFPAYLTVASHGDSAAESVFASHLFCCSTSVKSEADVHLIKYNTLIINSCLYQLWHIDRGLAQLMAYFASDFRKPFQSLQWKFRSEIYVGDSQGERLLESWDHPKMCTCRIK